MEEAQNNPPERVTLFRGSALHAHPEIVWDVAEEVEVQFSGSDSSATM